MKKWELSESVVEVLEFLGESNCLLGNEGKCIRFLADMDSNNPLPSNVFLISEQFLLANIKKHTVSYTIAYKMPNDINLLVYFDSVSFLIGHNLSTMQSLPQYNTNSVSPSTVEGYDLFEVYKWLTINHVKGICKIVLQNNSSVAPTVLIESYVDRYQIQAYLASETTIKTKTPSIIC